MLRLADRMLATRATVYAACVASLALGLVFVFVWSPLPWGWKGIDFYYEIALGLARGEPFPTVHLVWGYAYFLAFWYRLCGDRQWVPLVVQVVLNATVPLMLYRLVRIGLGERVAIGTALLAGVLSFSTVYASTQASDSVCTAIIVATMLCLAIADSGGRVRWFAAAGLLAGIAYQFRPNLILFPPFTAAAYWLIRPRTRRTLGRLAVFLLVFAAAGAPWVVRNYWWTGLFIPASTHGGVQLWFGTLQSGAYEESWIYNPRAAYENPSVDYTSVTELPIVITATASWCAPNPHRFDLVWWTNRDRTPVRESAAPDAQRRLAFTVPAQPDGTALYYYLENANKPTDSAGRVPPTAPAVPSMLVVSRNHLGDLDVDGYVLDVYDVARMLRHVAWNEPISDRRLDLDGDGAVTEPDVRLAVSLLLDDRATIAKVSDEVLEVRRAPGSATIALRDGSVVGVPQDWSGKVTDLVLETVGVESMAARVVSRSRPFATLAAEPPADRCPPAVDVGANRVPYRRLPHEQRRFEALAVDNIRHAPAAYLKASLDRALRVFIIEGSEDTRTAYQFPRARLVYAVGRAASLLYLVLLVAGVVVAVRRRAAIGLLLIPIVYVPLTICFMLINARYSMTTQPFAFAFVATAIVAAIDRVRRPVQADARVPQ